MAMLHYQRVGADAVGTTLATKETIGTVTLPSDATNVWAIIGQRGSTATTTTGEGSAGRYYVNPRSLGYQEFNFGSNPVGALPATNIGAIFDPGVYIPFRSSTGQPPANEQITFQYDTVSAQTAEDYAQCFVLSSNGGIDAKVLNNRGLGLDGVKNWVDWSDMAYDDEIGDATSEKFDNSVTVPGSVKLIHSCMVSVGLNAVTSAGEHLAGYLTLSGTMPGLYPMDIPIPLQAASLGTPVNIPENGCFGYVYPLYIPGTDKNETIDVTANLAATLSDTADISVTFFGSV